MVINICTRSRLIVTGRHHLRCVDLSTWWSVEVGQAVLVAEVRVEVARVEKAEPQLVARRHPQVLHGVTGRSMLVLGGMAELEMAETELQHPLRPRHLQLCPLLPPAVAVGPQVATARMVSTQVLVDEG